MTLPLALFAVAAAIEAASAWALLRGTGAPLAIAFAHASSALLATLALARAAPGQQPGEDDPEPGDEGRAAAIAAAGGALAFLAPPFGVVAAAALGLAAGRRAAGHRFASAFDLPEPPAAAEARPGPGADTPDRLLDDLRFGDVSRRRAAAERLRGIAARESVAALRRALCDPDLEVRALAQAALAAAEERVSRDILAARDQVRRAPDDPRAHAGLANQYAEYCYLGVLDEVTSRYYLELAVKGYARALEIGRERGSSWDGAAATLLAIGKALLALGRARLAATFFERAALAAPGDPRPLVWQAEAAFLEGDLARVRAECARAAALAPEDPRVREVVEYWRGGPKAPSGPAEATPNTGDAAAPSAAEAEGLAEAGSARAFDDRASTLEAEMREIARDLASADPLARAAAFHRLLAFESETAADALAAAIKDAPEGVHVLYCRYLARLAASGRAAVLDRIARLLDSRTDAIRREAALALEAAPPTLARTETLVRTLARGHVFARIHAANALAAAPDAPGIDGAVPELVRALEDRTLEVREAALLALRAIRPEEAPAAIEPLATDPSPEVRWKAIAMLAEMGAGARAARRRLADPSGRVRQVAAWALGRLRDRRAVAALARVLSDDEEAWVRAEAARALGRIADARAVGALLRAAAFDASRVVRRIASFAIDAAPRGDALPALIEALHGEDAALRYAAAIKLGDTGSPLAIEPLAGRLARDGIAAVRAGAAEALGRIGRAAAAAPLESALADESEAVVYAAAVALRAIDRRAGLETIARRLDVDLPPLVEQALLRFVEDCAAATAPGERVPEAVFAFASRKLVSPTSNVRYLAIQALARAGRTEALEPLLEVAERDPVKDIRAAAAAALARVLGGNPAPLLERLGRPEASAARVEALVGALAAIPAGTPGRAEAARGLLAAAADLRRAGRLSAEAERRLRRFFEADPAALAAAAAGDGAAVGGRAGGPAPRIEALRWIATLAPAGAREAARRALGEADPALVAAAATALGALRDEDSLGRLVALALAASGEGEVAAAARTAARAICAPPRPAPGTRAEAGRA